MNLHKFFQSVGKCQYVICQLIYKLTDTLYIIFKMSVKKTPYRQTDMTTLTDTYDSLIVIITTFLQLFTTTTHTTDTTHYHTGNNVVDVVCGRCGSTSVRGVKT